MEVRWCPCVLRALLKNTSCEQLKFKYNTIDPRNWGDGRDEAKDLDIFWMMCHAMDHSKTLMWAGFSAQFHMDSLPEQVVLYMMNMNQTITSLNVIQERLVTSQKCAWECGQQYGIVTYDLNAAKSAWQSQVMETPWFDDVFMMPGPFQATLKTLESWLKSLVDPRCW